MRAESGGLGDSNSGKTDHSVIPDADPPLVYDSIDGSRCILQFKDKDVKS